MALCKAGQQTTQCLTDKTTRVGVDIAVALATVYFAATYILLWWKLSWFKKMPYAAVKKGIVYFTLQVFIDAKLLWSIATACVASYCS